MELCVINRWLAGGVGFVCESPGVRLLCTCSMWGPGTWRAGMERYGRRRVKHQDTNKHRKRNLIFWAQKQCDDIMPGEV